MLEAASVVKGLRLLTFRRNSLGSQNPVGAKWNRRGSNPGPSACEADVIPLHHNPVATTAAPSAQSVTQNILGARLLEKYYRPGLNRGPSAC